MKILLCAATEMEVAPTIQYLTQHPGPSVDVLISGVGMVAATYSLAKAVATHRPDLIIQAGVAGSLDLSQPLTEVVVVRNETIGDLGVQEESRFRSLFDMKLLGRNTAPWTDGKLRNEYDLVEAAGLPVVDGVTVNEVSTGEERIAYYRNQLGAQVESMEGAALHFVGLMEKIPFLQLRSLSNYIAERDKTKWKMEKAIVRLNHELQNLLRKKMTL